VALKALYSFNSLLEAIVLWKALKAIVFMPSLLLEPKNDLGHGRWGTRSDTLNT